MRIRTITIICAAAVAVAGLAGCGSSSTASSSGTAPASATGSATARAGSVGSVVYAWGSFGSDRRAHSKLPMGGGGGGRRHGGGDAGVGAGGDAGGRGATRRPVVVHGIVGTVRQISTSNSDGYALTTSGAVYAWGDGAAGQLGNGTTAARSVAAVRVHFPSGVRIASLPDPMPFDEGMAIDTRGDVWGWGNDENRELCLPTSADLDMPTRLPLSHVTRAIGAQRHAMYETGGRIVSCGFGQFGQLGDGTSGPTAQTTGPVAVKGLPSGPVAAFTAGYGDSGVLMADGAYDDWGLNAGGQVGDGSRTDAATARRVALPARVTRVDEGGSVRANGQAMALLADGQLWEWGTGTHGQLGNGTVADSLMPIRLPEPPGVHFVSFSSGGATDYGITAAGALYAWGNNGQGELGNGSTAHMSTTPVRDPIVVAQVSSTAGNVAALGRPGS